jgi:hypothetical protein
LKDERFIRDGGDEKRVYACGRQDGVAGKLVADVNIPNKDFFLYIRKLFMYV